MSYIVKDSLAKSFNHSFDATSLELDALVNILYEETTLNRATIHKRGLKLILINLIIFSGVKLLISRDHNYKSLSRYNALDVGVSALNTVIEALHRSKYIALIIGKNLPYGNGIKSSIEATEMLKDRLNPIALQLNPTELVLFREDKKNGSKQLIDYKDTLRSVRIRNELEAYNKFLSTIHIELRDSFGLEVVRHFNYQVIQRKFIDNGEVDIQGHPLFNSGGRASSTWTNLGKSSERANIFMDNEPTIEVDYQASSINVLYKALTGKPFQGDPYTLTVGDFVIPRHLVKQIATISLNSTSSVGVSSTVGKVYGALRTSLKVEDQLKAKEYQSTQIKIQIKVILEAFLTTHEPIRHMFLKGKDIWNKVQCLESDLVFAVVNQLTQLGMPVLTVHDSFIVKATDKAILDTLMTTNGFPDQDLVRGLI